MRLTPNTPVRLTPNTPVRLTPQRQRVLGVLAGRIVPGSVLAREAGVGTSVIRGMADAGLLVQAAVPAAPPFATPDAAHAHPVLSADQARIAVELRAAVTARAFSVTLLDGVTGSGKTEVYLEAVAECLAAGRQALILLPEIALSAQFLSRFRTPFWMRTGFVAFRSGLPHPAASPGARWRMARRRSSSAPGPLCFCRSRIWVW